MTSDGLGKTFAYDADNRLTSVSGAVSATLSYDPAGRLYQVVGTSTTRFLYDGGQAIAEYDGSGTLLRRYVPGAGKDETLVWYEGLGTTDRRWLLADPRGSVIAISNASGVVTNINKYDEYGAPDANNVGRFQYTGQIWLAEAGLYHYKARQYNPALGRFMQTDPIGYGDGMNMYAYVGNDPINSADPSGLDEIIVVGHRSKQTTGHDALVLSFNLSSGFGGFGGSGGGAGGAGGDGKKNKTDCDSGKHVNKPPGVIPSFVNTGDIAASAAGRNAPLLNQVAGQLGGIGQGIGDAFTFGLYSKAWASLPGDYGSVYARQATTVGHDAGLGVTTILSIGRLAYAGAAASIQYTASSGQLAVAQRNALKGSASFLSYIGKAHPRTYNYSSLLSKYGSDLEVKLAAARTNADLNLLAAIAATSGSEQAVSNSSCSN